MKNSWSLFRKGKFIPEVATERRGYRRILELANPSWTWDRPGLG